jgi:orotidine-5'-phosphate decarboxylase
MENPIILALDGVSRDLALTVARRLSGKIWGFKLNDLYFAHGPEILAAFAKHGRVFLDAKFHDIPNTVANTVGRLAGQPADIITVHASGGPAMIRAAAQAAPDRIAAVTVMTAIDAQLCERVYNQQPNEQVRSLAEIAVEGEATYLVSSAHELHRVSDLNLVKIVPGIRPLWYSAAGDDQRRVMTPVQAMEAGAQLLVIGRPILSSPDPIEAAERTIEEIERG